ncbi:MAG: Ger(x)C family spore germination protein [Bacilli bacterium]|nr:Ger(x)C family spore germination protein [Bacilli bacterium]
MKYLKLLIIVPIIFLITGCYNYRELNDLGITTAIGISKENDLYKLSIEVLKTEVNGDSDADMPKFIVFESTGRTIQEALRNTILESTKRLYVDHLAILIIDEDVAKDGISEIMDLFFRDPESRKQFYILISKVDVNKLLNTESLLEEVNSKSIFERLKSNEDYLNSVVSITYSKLLSKYVNPYIELSIPTITLEDVEVKRENLPSKKIVLEDIAIFKDDKLVGYITKEDALYLNFILNNVKDTILTVEDKDSYNSIEVIKSDTKIDVSNNNININIKLCGNIAEVNSVNDLTNPNTINYLEDLFEQDLNSKIKNSIDKIIKEYDSDIYGFRDLIYKKDYKHFNENIKLKDLNIKIDTQVELKYKGNGAYELDER